jgi:hypothetical protein
MRTDTFNSTRFKDRRIVGNCNPKLNNRDHNAALNLRNNAISFIKELNYTVGTMGSYLIVYACGEVGCRKTETSVKQEKINVSCFIESNCLKTVGSSKGVCYEKE